MEHIILLKAGSISKTLMVDKIDPKSISLWLDEPDSEYQVLERTIGNETFALIVNSNCLASFPRNGASHIGSAIRFAHATNEPIEILAGNLIICKIHHGELIGLTGQEVCKVQRYINDAAYFKSIKAIPDNPIIYDKSLYPITFEDNSQFLMYR